MGIQAESFISHLSASENDISKAFASIANSHQYIWSWVWFTYKWTSRWTLGFTRRLVLTPRQMRATWEWSIYTGAITPGLTRPQSGPDQYQSAAPAQVRPYLSLSHASADLLYESSCPKYDYSLKTVQWLYCSILRLIGHDSFLLLVNCITR